MGFIFYLGLEVVIDQGHRIFRIYQKSKYQTLGRYIKAKFCRSGFWVLGSEVKKRSVEPQPATSSAESNIEPQNSEGWFRYAQSFF
jgi:hypothetical protein